MSATDTVSPTAVSIDLAGACATLKTWLLAHEDENLDVSTAQVALRAVVETMLVNWTDSPEADGGPRGQFLMMGVNLASLAEQALWAGMTADSLQAVPGFVRDTVGRSLRLLEQAA